MWFISCDNVPLMLFSRLRWQLGISKHLQAWAALFAETFLMGSKYLARWISKEAKHSEMTLFIRAGGDGLTQHHWVSLAAYARLHTDSPFISLKTGGFSDMRFTPEKRSFYAQMQTPLCTGEKRSICDRLQRQYLQSPQQPHVNKRILTDVLSRSEWNVQSPVTGKEYA